MKRVIGIGLVLVVAAVAAYWWWSQRAVASAAAGTLVTITVSRGTIVGEVAASGSVTAAQSVALSFRTPGVVAAVHVAEGDAVPAGAVLAELDASDLALQQRQARAGLALAQAQLLKVTEPPAPADVNAAQAALASATAARDRLLSGPTQQQLTTAQAQLQKAEVAVQQAQAAYDQVKWVGGIAALQPSLTLQAATTDLEVARANYAAATGAPAAADLRAAEAQVAQAQAQLDRLLAGPTDADMAAGRAQLEQAQIAVEQADLQMANATLVAPFAGTVTGLTLEVGQVVGGAAPALTLVGGGPFSVTALVDETDVGTIELGQPARLEPESFPGVTIPGHITLIASAPSAGASALSEGLVQYQVRIAVDEPFAGLRDGMTAQVTVEVARYDGILVVPNDAVQVDRVQGITYVERLVDGVPVPTEVVLGVSGAGVTEVIAGIGEGDVLVERSTSVREQLRGALGGQ
jgi:multidrug efflux pump subunit AcrA (membrane-fusion protein)